MSSNVLYRCHPIMCNIGFDNFLLKHLDLPIKWSDVLYPSLLLRSAPFRARPGTAALNEPVRQRYGLAPNRVHHLDVSTFNSLFWSWLVAWLNFPDVCISDACLCLDCSALECPVFCAWTCKRPDSNRLAFGSLLKLGYGVVTFGSSRAQLYT
jgi:hypothetical protein